MKPVRLQRASPQLFVRDIDASLAWFGRFGFETVFTSGEPAFYGQVRRDDATLNLRVVDDDVFVAGVRDRDELLAAYVVAGDVARLSREFAAAGAVFARAYGETPWGTREFVVRDPDGNLLCFGDEGRQGAE